MARATYDAFRENLAGYLDDVAAGRTTLLVTRQGGGNVVVMSAEAFAGWEETMHLLRSPANAARLLASIAEAEAGAAEGRELIER
jgi:antitoxin YefM